MHRERNGITLPQLHHLHAALHAWSLFCQNEFATSEILSRFGEKNGNLERKGKIAVEVLVQAVEVARDILQQQRRRSRLAASVALLQEISVLCRISSIDIHANVPLMAITARRG